MLGNRVLEQERIEEPQAVLQELARQGGNFVLFATLRGPDTLPAIAEEIAGGMPAFDHIQPFVDLVTEVERGQILTEVDGLFDFPQRRERFVRGMRDVRGVEALEDRLGCGRARLEGDRMLNHLVVLLDHQVPPNRAAEAPRQVGECPRHTRVGEVEAFILDALEAGHQAHTTSQVAKRQGDLGRAVRVHTVLLHPHRRIVADQAFDHGCHC
jgi:hypothetical protein